MATLQNLGNHSNHMSRPLIINQWLLDFLCLHQFGPVLSLLLGQLLTEFATLILALGPGLCGACGGLLGVQRFGCASQSVSWRVVCVCWLFGRLFLEWDVFRLCWFGRLSRWWCSSCGPARRGRGLALAETRTHRCSRRQVCVE